MTTGIHVSVCGMRAAGLRSRPCLRFPGASRLDLVDEFVWVNDFIGARQVLERNLFPIMQGVGLASRVLETRALYAVQCSPIVATIRRQPTRWRDSGLSRRRWHRDIPRREQKRLIENIRRFGGPRQREVHISVLLQALFDQCRGAAKAVESRRKIGRNERCPYGSGRKYKQCHGR